METWHQIPAQTRLEQAALVNEARAKKLKVIPVKREGKYVSLLRANLDDKEELLAGFVPPVVPKDYEEDETEDLNMMLEAAKELTEEKEKITVAKLLALEIKRLTEKKRIITVFTPDKTYVRKVGGLYGKKFNELILQVTGDHRGMTVWNTLPLNSVRKLQV